MYNKKLIKTRFKKAIKTYNESAVVQKYMARKLVEVVVRRENNVFPNVFEIGMGTGYLTSQIVEKIDYNNLFLNDIIEDCESICPEKSEFILGDAEKIEFPDPLDLILSNATFQWFDNPKTVISKAAEALNKGGILAFSTFGPKTYFEIKDITKKGLSYYSKNEIEMLVANDFEIVEFITEEQKLTFDTPVDVLKHIKLTGTNAIAPTKWTKSKLEEFIRSYVDKFCMYNKVKLTYEPYFIILRKR